MNRLFSQQLCEDCVSAHGCEVLLVLNLNHVERLFSIIQISAINSIDN